MPRKRLRVLMAMAFYPRAGSAQVVRYLSQIVAGFRNPLVAFASGDVEIEGGAVELAQILPMFR